MRIRPLRDKLIIASLIVVIPFLIWNTHLLLDHISHLRREKLQESRDFARHIANDYAEKVSELTIINNSIGETVLSKGTMQPNEISRYLSKLSKGNRFFLHAAVTDDKGNVIASDMQKMVGINASSHPHVQQVMHGKRWSVSNAFTTNLEKEPLFAVNWGLRRPDGKFAGMIISFMNSNDLRHFVHESMVLSERNHERVVITDPRGKVFLTSGNFSINQGEWPRYPFVRAALSGKSSPFHDFKMPDGLAVTGSSVPVPKVGWTVSVFFPNEEILAPARRLAILDMLAMLFCSGLTVALAVYFGNRLSEPISVLSRSATLLGQGDLNVRTEVQTSDEFQLLSERFNDMAKALQERTNELHESLEKESRNRQTASALYLIAQGLVVNVYLDDRLEVIAQALASICEAKRCAILLKRGDKLIGTAGWGLLDAEGFRNMSIDFANYPEIERQILLSGKPMYISDAATDPRMPNEIAKLHSIKSFLALPMIRQRRLVGVAILDNLGEPIDCEEDTINAARRLATLAAIAIENAESFERWHKIGDAFQTAMLPNVPAQVGSFQIATSYYAAIGTAELGGDFYDLITLPDGRVGIVIADVSGKGLEAAVFTAMGKYTVRAFAAENPDPASVLTRTNAVISRVASDMGFITMFFGVLDPKTGSLIYSNAGHPPPVITDESGKSHWLSSKEFQPPIGILDEVEYGRNEVTIERGEVLTCYTDGVIEARHNGTMFDVEGLCSLLETIHDRTPDEINEAIHSSVQGFSQGMMQDDIAMLVAKRINN